MIRVKNPEGRIGYNVQEFINKAQIKTACIYAIYGYFDFLVRLWATPLKIKWFSNEVENDTTLIEEIREFRVNHINYEGASNLNYGDSLTNRRTHSHEHIPSLKGKRHIEIPLIKFESDVRNISALDEKHGKILTEHTCVQSLIKNGLIWKFKQINGISFKFYIALSRISIVISKEQVIKNINHFLNKSKKELGLHNIAVYEGIGFSDFLVKTVVENYSDVWRCIEKILESEDLNQLRPTTYLIAAIVMESDVADCTWNELSNNLLKLVTLLGSSYVEMMQEISAEDQVVFTNLFGKFLYLNDTIFSGIFLGLFQARLKESTLLLAEKLLFIFQLESLLGAFIKKNCIDVFKENYWEVIKSVARACSVSTEDEKTKKWNDKKPEDYTFHNSVSVLNKLYANYPELKVETNKIITDDDLDAMQSLVEIRNDLAHGRMLSNREFVTTKWENITRRVFSVGDAYTKLVQWQDQLNKSKGDLK